MYLENQESVREKSGKSQGKILFKVCGNPEKQLHEETCGEYEKNEIPENQIVMNLTCACRVNQITVWRVNTETCGEC